MSTHDVIVHARKPYDERLLAKLAIGHGWSADPNLEAEGVLVQALSQKSPG
jgi:hypothetical protein